MNFNIILIILTYIIINISGTDVDSIKNSGLGDAYSEYLFSSTVDDIELPSENTYCECEYHNPLLVLGEPFDVTYIQKMCEIKITGHADISKEVKFTPIGSRVCNTVCKKCFINIQLEYKQKNLKITLIEHYCEMVNKHSEFITNLATQCVCVYHIQSKNWKMVIVYKIHSNSQGFVKFESN